MRTSTSISLSDKDKQKMKKLMKIYDAESLSELIRILIAAEIDRVTFYQNLAM